MILSKPYNILLLILLVELAIARRADNPFVNGHIPESKLPEGGQDLDGPAYRRLLSNTVSGKESELVWESNLDPGAIIRPSHALSSKAASRIAWGKEAKEGMFPYVVYFDGGGYLCTGSVIAPKAILTAAHCVRDESGWAKASDISIYAGSVVYDNTGTYYVKALYTPKYDLDTSYGDIAIVELTAPLPSSIKPVALASKSTSWAGIKKVTAVGWGTMENDALPDILKYAQIGVMTAADCKEWHEYLMGEMAIDHMCFGLLTNPATATCEGDSGGPYLIMRTGKQPIQVAVVSYGPSVYNCGDPENNVDVPTSVAYWRTWIDTTLKAHKLKP